MQIKIKRKIGDSELEFSIDEKEDISALVKASSITSIPNRCSLCLSDQIHLSSNRTKEGFIFIKIICDKCFAQSNMGQYKTGGIFWKKFDKYVPGVQVQTQTLTENEISAGGF